ncbi:MAG: hypothetical protein HXX16_16575 [Bacteroidales bacterium]|nr:hypothetical protein [Bacteroidales bacterium]
MKELKELKGAKILSKNEQKAIVGGIACYDGSGNWLCDSTGCCYHGHCALPSQCL